MERNARYPDPIPLGEYRGFTMELYFEAREYKVRLKGELGYPVTLGTDAFGKAVVEKE